MIFDGHVSPWFAFVGLVLVGIAFGILVYVVQARRDRRIINRELAELDRLARQYETVR